MVNIDFIVVSKYFLDSWIEMSATSFDINLLARNSSRTIPVFPKSNMSITDSDDFRFDFL